MKILRRLYWDGPTHCDVFLIKAKIIYFLTLILAGKFLIAVTCFKCREMPLLNDVAQIYNISNHIHIFDSV
jgi:hypothetical protein